MAKFAISKLTPLNGLTNLGLLCLRQFLVLVFYCLFTVVFQDGGEKRGLPVLREETGEEGMLVEDTEKVPFSFSSFLSFLIFMVVVILTAVVNCNIRCH